MKKAARKSSRSSPATSGKTRPRTECVAPDPADPRRKLKVSIPAKASPKDRAEARRYVETLEANRQIARGSGDMPPGTTHRVEPDASGAPRLVRKRFSAI